MSWFQSLRDDFTLRPFESEETTSDSAAMASGPPDVMANQEPAEVQEECSGKKKSKFQTFKKFFARKKRKEPSAAGADAGLKASQSSDNVSKTSENNTLTRSEKDKGSGSKISLGSKALSHDSVFVSDSSEANEALGASQDSIHGKVKSLQVQLKQAIRLGSPPSLMCVKRADDAGTMSEDDGLPCSPPEYTTLHTAMNQAQRNSSISLEGIDSDDDQLSCAASSRAMSPLVVPGDFSQPASPFACLDNSAAKHKLGLRHKACNKRKPASRLEVKTEADSVVDETLNASITEVLEEQQQQKREAVSFDALKPKVKREDEEEKEEEKEEEEKEQPQQSRQSLLRDKEEREEGEDESEAEQDVSQSLDTSSPTPEPSLPEEEAPEAQPLPSSEPSSRASSLDSPRVTPETPAGLKEYLLDPPGIAYGAEDNRGGSELLLRTEEDGVQENKEEESSFLQEVLSSLKTPLASSSLGVDTEGVILEMEATTGKEEEAEEAETEDGEEVKEEEAEVDEGVGYLAAPSASLMDHTTEEEEEDSTPPCREETLPTEEEAQSEEEEEEAEEEEEEEEELVVERFSQHDQGEAEAEEEEAEEAEPEETDDTLARKTDLQEQEESQEGESEEAIELEKEPEVEEEGREKREEEEEQVKLVRGRLEDAEEASEEEKEEAEEVTETFHNAAEEEVGIILSSQEAAEGADAVVGDDTVFTTRQVSDDETLTKQEDQELDKEQEQEEHCETVEEGAKADDSEEKSEEDQPDVDEPEEEQVEVSCLDTNQVDKDETEVTEQEQATVPSTLPSLSLSTPQHETQTQESGPVSPSKTTTIHINLVSPSSEKVTSFFQQPTTPADLQENISESPSHEQHPVSADEEQADTVEEVEEEKQSALVNEATSTPVEDMDMVNQPSSSSDQSKARFTIAPAWQRSQSLTPPSSPPAYVSSAITASGPEEVEAPTKKDPAVNTEPESSPKVELVLSPSRARNAGNAAAKPQSDASPSPSSTKPQTSAPASTEESSVVVEGNPDNPFGVRLRKTSALHRFSSEEENTESPIEPPVQPTSCKPEPPQPISIKPSVSQPTSSKPALPKKPDVHGDSGGKTKRISDAAASRGVSSGSDSPSWISVAKQKQKIYKENSLEEITVKKEEQDRKSSLPMYVSSAAGREQSNKTAESASKASSSEVNKTPVSVEKEAKRALSPPTPVPPQPSKAPSLPCPVPPKPQVPPATTKPPPQPTPHHRSLSPPTPVPVPQKSPSCTSPPSLSKTPTSLPSSKTTQPQSTTANSAPFSPRTAALEKPGSRAPGVSGQTPPSQRGLPPAALPQDEPPWMALAKKKAKAWSEMPQIVQ